MYSLMNRFLSTSSRVNSMILAFELRRRAARVELLSQSTSLCEPNKEAALLRSYNCPCSLSTYLVQAVPYSYTFVYRAALPLANSAICLRSSFLSSWLCRWSTSTSASLLRRRAFSVRRKASSIGDDNSKKSVGEALRCRPLTGCVYLSELAQFPTDFFQKPCLLTTHVPPLHLCLAQLSSNSLSIILCINFRDCCLFGGQ